jgi:hypothetical protein
MQLVNVTYTAITEWMEAKEQAKFDRQLLAGDPATVSTGTNELMALMGVVPPRPGRQGA